MKLTKMIMLAVMTTCLPLQQAFCAPIESVQVQVIDIEGSTSAPLLQKMGSSMRVVAEQLLLDKDTVQINQAKAAYEKLLVDVGDRVFTGYELQKAELQLGNTSQIALYVRPWSQVIQKATIDLQFSGIEPQTAQLLEARMPKLREELGKTINGASVDASDWASGVLRKMVREQVEQALPEFKAAVDLVQEKGKTIVQVIVYPVGQEVRQVEYEMRSESIPNLLLIQLKYKYLAEGDKLRGLPVAYVEHHRVELEQLLVQKLLQEKEIKNYQLKPVVKIDPGSKLGLSILLNSDKYKIWLEGYGDVGRDKNNLSGKAHVGKFISGKDEVFGEAELILDDVQWNFGLGYTHYWGKSNWSYMRRIPLADNVYKLEYNLGPKWTLRAEHHSGDNRNEYGVRYRIHEFLSAEYVYGGKEFYLRIIGNL